MQSKSQSVDYDLKFIRKKNKSQRSGNTEHTETKLLKRSLLSEKSGILTKFSENNSSTSQHQYLKFYPIIFKRTVKIKIQV